MVFREPSEPWLRSTTRGEPLRDLHGFLGRYVEIVVRCVFDRAQVLTGEEAQRLQAESVLIVLPETQPLLVLDEGIILRRSVSKAFRPEECHAPRTRELVVRRRRYRGDAPPDYLLERANEC